ncbi:hypothetical protein [Alkaliphilus sp. B6464]|uniref:hypothetical protein n=1 Tax=Alkaliphilus sp. B6464 TaxID=2731219 RepID=UPI001BAD8EAA|nr:hypothetical protein [Alkaliphilus sp. B6464]QUH21457.1 hypothetical protein HYG84_17245 [Alkaliphilus sp. B6464]
MKLSEVIAILEEKPNKTFISDKDTPNEITAQSNNTVISFRYTQDNNEFVRAIFIDRDWQEVKQPVTFTEAIKALEKESSVYCEVDQRLYLYKAPKHEFHEILGTNGAGISIGEILYGKWYID